MLGQPLMIVRASIGFSVLNNLTKLEDLIIEKSCVNKKTSTKLQNKIKEIKKSINDLIKKHETRNALVSLIPGASFLINQPFEKWAREIETAIKLVANLDSEIPENIATNVYTILQTVAEKSLAKQ